MTDKMDKLLAQLPSPPPPPDLARRICLAVHGQRQAQSPFAWAGRRTRIFAWGAGLAGLTLLALLLLELAPLSVWQDVIIGLLAWLGQLWVTPIDALLGLWQALALEWQDFAGLGFTVLPLALALLALAAFAMASYWLSSWTDHPFQTGDTLT